MRTVTYKQIGIIHSAIKQTVGAPIQTASAKNIEGTVELFPKYAHGLKDVAGFSHLILLYHFHLARKTSLVVTPFLDSEKRGVFATRSPARPNPIGLSIVRLKSIRNGVLHVQELDVVDGTPLLDIKPYVPRIDVRKTMKIGWYKNNIHKLQRTGADRRFTR
jgi:tRNA-Thr(GGU) m(6)t(6)A37 methyltransferase TsaA